MFVHHLGAWILPAAFLTAIVAVVVWLFAGYLPINWLLGIYIVCAVISASTAPT